VINKIKKNQSYFTDLEDLRSKNMKLEEENKELSEQVRELEILRSENKQLQEFMNLTEKYSTYDTIPAYVISKDISNYSNNIVVNVGKKDGVEKNMVVIADQGLVGHVISVTETSSKIKVIVD
jgi:rod shape-determining protein MreC